MRPRNRFYVLLMTVSLLVCSLVLAASSIAAQQQNTQPPQSGNSKTPAPQKSTGGYKINVNVNMVVLHVTVLDHHGQMVNDLGEKNFRVYEDGVPQKISTFSHADIPVTMGIVIDDSGSMLTKRPSVNAAALTFVKTSNPDDQVFVVNFNDAYYLDTPGNFATNMQELRAALNKIDSRGGTALYDAIYASISHLKLGDRDKKALLVITDGEDNASRFTLDDLIRYEERSNVVIYTIGLLGDEQPGGLFKIHGSGDKKAAKVLKEIAKASGGQAYFPRSLDQVDATCQRIAHDIRDQYTLAYYPTNPARDGSFRNVKIELVGRDTKHDIVRAKPGYYAPKAEATTAMTTASK